MRFLLVSLGLHPDVVGGAWRVAAAQAAGLAARGHSVHVVTAQPDPPRALQESRDGFTVQRFEQPSGHFFTNWRTENRAARSLISHLIRKSQTPTLLVQHHPYLGPATASTPPSIPILHFFHGPWAEEYRLAQTARPRGIARRLLDIGIIRMLHRVEHKALRRAHRIITLSRHFSDNLKRWHPGLSAPVEIVPGGVDLNQFHPIPESQRSALRKAYELGPRDRLFVALRRLDPRMGLDVLIHAFARIHHNHPHAHLWLTGRGPAESTLRALIQQHQLDASVRLLGFVPDEELPRLLNAADAALMPSLDLEGFGLATAEALACGTPVLGSHAGATPELLAPLDPNLLFPAASIDGLAEILHRFLSEPDRLPSRSRCAAYARERYSWNHQLTACESAAAELNSAIRSRAA